MAHGNQFIHAFLAGVNREFFKKVFKEIKDELSCEEMALDSITVHAHGASKKGEQKIGRSAAGLTTKIHLATDSVGNPEIIKLSSGMFMILKRHLNF